MANKMLFDDTRALRREQREARIARKRERRDARTLKYQRLEIALDSAALDTADATTAEWAPEQEADRAPSSAAESAAPTGGLETPVAAAEVAAEPQPPVPQPAEPHKPAGQDDRGRERAGRRGSRRERDIEQFLAHRDQLLSLAREEARERITRVGEDEAVCDALVALAHPEASPWRRHRERLSEAIAGRRIPEVGAAARRGCRGAAADAARTSRRAPDQDIALAVTVAHAVIARAPWAAVRGRRAERSGPAGQPRAFWR
jgi:hypothetical protein